MNALDWLRNKATPVPAEEIEAEGVKYRIERKVFRGNLPFRMAKELRGCKGLIKTETVNEVLLLGGQYRSQAGQCEFFHTEYVRV